MSHNREEVLKKLKDNRPVLKGFGVKRLGLFGSIARDRGHSSSDLDFVVELEHKTFDAYMDLKLFLENLFGSKVDLVLAENIKPRLRSQILNELIDAA